MITVTSPSDGSPPPAPGADPGEPPAPSGQDADRSACRTGRAAPMAADDRRAAIVRAVVPLLCARGTSVTTRELAAAAEVAEGTLFRVFPDKDSLVRAALHQAVDPTPFLEDLAAIEPGTDLRATLHVAVGSLLERSRDAARVLTVAHQLAEQEHAAGSPSTDDPHTHPRGPGAHRQGMHQIEVVTEAIRTLLAPHQERLRLDPGLCAHLVVGLVLTASRPLTQEALAALGPHDLVDVFLDGALRTPEGSC
ncbi:TetR/AcrR family transcriptional regulator [Actinotalea sp. K2]|uniref:TetR/AcrR family transcriptional regulator n=1 Tax=Actinotalea sp. K2 TaxID=2939438 RepID=UPI002017F40C|nr:TetR/AcrR family transcriptional regulator [Actinotalea sp. K2]MCL3861937.1 TetR/AcrR family transcriptional regulator [Actinotalea sp. K2]